MSLELRKSSNWWYGVFTANGQRQVINLGVPITGRRPPKRTMLGDDEFERSRGKAMAAYDQQLKALSEDRTTEKALRKIVELKTGRGVGFPKLADLAELWTSIPRRRPPGRHYLSQCRGILQRFVSFAIETQPGVSEFVDVKAQTAEAFLAAEEARGVSTSTWNYSLELLRTAFRRLHPKLTDGSNPFLGLLTKDAETVSRMPFSAEELAAIQSAGAQDPFIRPVILTGMCTAMRRGDCCLLKWADVDLQAGFISVKTSKTGETVDIPIFPLLREELERAQSKAGDAKFCFPEAAQMYRSNPDGITVRVKNVLARAFGQKDVQDGKRAAPPSPEVIHSRGLAYLDGLGGTAKAGRMRAVLLSYLGGKTINQVMAETGCGKGTVSAYLNEIESGIEARFIRGRKADDGKAVLQSARPRGLRRASIRDFHSFRVTWITLALTAGVPLELVQRVTGHRTVQVVMKHYFRPGREDFKQVILKAMPKMLSDGGDKPAKEEILAIVQAMTPETCGRDRARLLELLAAG